MQPLPQTFPQEEKEMTETRALQVLIDAVLLAQQRGAFHLLETPNIVIAIKKFTQPQQPIPASNGKKTEELEAISKY
jgi:hypothetical protein